MEEWLDKKATVIFKIGGVTTWKTNNYNTHITQQLRKKKRQPDNEVCLVIESNARDMFLQK